jgi:hypothetical protein
MKMRQVLASPYTVHTAPHRTAVADIIDRAISQTCGIKGCQMSRVYFVLSTYLSLHDFVLVFFFFKDHIPTMARSQRKRPVCQTSFTQVHLVAHGRSRKFCARTPFSIRIFIDKLFVSRHEPDG